jgi:hypothetical protein
VNSGKHKKILDFFDYISPLIKFTKPKNSKSFGDNNVDFNADFMPNDIYLIIFLTRFGNKG